MESSFIRGQPAAAICRPGLRGWAWSALLATLLTGCGANPKQPAALESARQELERLQADSGEAQRMRAENRELPRLKKENQEIAGLRGHEPDIAKLRQENEQLRDQIKSAGKTRGASLSAGGPGQGSSPAAPAGRPGSTEGQIHLTDLTAADPNTPQDGDQLLIEPRLLSKLFPNFDWSKIERKEPIAINDLLVQQGITITNYQQLHVFGVTNYVVQRAPPKPQGEIQK